MFGIQRFINLVEKALMVATMLAYIPATILAFLPSDHTFTQAEIQAYELAYQQVQNGFIVHLNVADPCTYREALLNNEYCFQRASRGARMKQYSSSSGSCAGTSYIYEKLNLLICSDQQVQNQFIQSNGAIQQSHTDLKLPIYTISPPFASPTIVYYSYVPSNDISCQASANYLTKDIQTRVSDYIFRSFSSAIVYMWYFATFLLAVLIGMLIADLCLKSVNLRPHAVVVFMVFSLAVCSIFIYAMSFQTQTQQLKDSTLDLGNCFVGTIKTTLTAMSKRLSFGLGFSFIFFTGVVLVLLCLIVIGELVLKLLSLRHTQLQNDPEFGFQLYRMHQ